MKLARNLNELREMLLKMKAEAENVPVPPPSHTTDYNSESAGDECDRAQAQREKEMELLMGSRDKQRLRSIKAALSRLENGLYGICEECEEDIPNGRLKAMPFARYCVQCQSAIEKHQKQVGGGSGYEMEDLFNDPADDEGEE